MITGTEDAMHIHALRLSPGEDLRLSLDELARRENLEAACILNCVGSLHRALLRFADRDGASELGGPLEIICLSGTLSRHGGHYHLAVADGEGRVMGGHLLVGCEVRTTAEIVVGELPGLSFRREPDPATGYRELVIRPGRADRRER